MMQAMMVKDKWPSGTVGVIQSKSINKTSLSFVNLVRNYEINTEFSLGFA